MDTATTSPSSDYYSASPEADEFSYKSMSRAAILSLTMSLIGVIGWFVPLLLIFSFLGVLLGFIALVNLKKYPAELTGKPVAILGWIIGLALLIASPPVHIYTYYTEVPEGYERVPFAALKSPMGAPDIPPPSAIELDKKKIFIKGYIHPTSLSSSSAKSFVLVPDWATCCFGTQPPLTHMVEVRLVNDQFAGKDMRQHKLAGTFSVRPIPKQVEGLNAVVYQLDAEHFQ